MDNEGFQAVIFTESYDTGFGPLTLSQPKTLMPLVNRPLLEYTLDMLTRSNVSEIFLFCNQHSVEIKNFVNQYQQKQYSKIKIEVFVSEEYSNLGAAIRDLDDKGLIKSNFILINGDCVGNLKLDELINVHKQNMRNDPGCVMTCVFRKVESKHRIRSPENEVLVVSDPRQKIVHFAKVNTEKNITIPTKLFQDSDIELHYDLLDTHISICSDKVPPDFSDNFDYETREDFINGLIADDELRQHYIYAHVLECGYAARATSVLTYDSISRDIIQRFVYPIVPECSHQRKSALMGPGVYIEDKVNVMNNSKIVKNVAIGKLTTIGTEVFISESVIGQNCRIADGVKIFGSYIWDNVTIESGCTIKNSIIASNVTIGKECQIGEHCVLASGVILDAGLHLKPSTQLIFDSDADTDHTLVGPNGVGSRFEQLDDEEDEDDEIKAANEKDDDDSSFSTSFSDSSEDRCDSPMDEFASFFNEVYDSLQRGIEENLIAENLILEINSSKHAYNVPMNEVNSIVVKALLSLALQEKSGKFFVTLKPYLSYALPVLKNYIRSEDSQNDCIYSLEEFYLTNRDAITAIEFVKITEFLYNSGLLDEDLILNWFNKPKSLPDHELAEQSSLRSGKEIALFIKWLQEAEEETSSEEEDED